MKTRTKTGILLVLLMAVAIVAALLCTQAKPNSTFADEAEIIGEQTDKYVVIDDPENISATYNYTKLTDTECSVRISNKAEATKAIIPSVATIDGKELFVSTV